MEGTRAGEELIYLVYVGEMPRTMRMLKKGNDPGKGISNVFFLGAKIISILLKGRRGIHQDWENRDTRATSAFRLRTLDQPLITCLECVISFVLRSRLSRLRHLFRRGTLLFWPLLPCGLPTSQKVVCALWYRSYLDKAMELRQAFELSGLVLHMMGTMHWKPCV